MGAFMSYFLVPREREMTRLLLKVVMQTTRWVADDLGLVTHDDPAARVGVLLNAARSMTELVDTGLLHTLPGAVCACRKPRPGHATRRYSLIRQAVWVRLRTRYRPRSTGSGRGFSGAAEFSDRCGRC